MATRLQIAKPDIVKRFEVMPHVLKTSDIAEVLDQERSFWRLAKSTSLRDFLGFMHEKTPLKEVRFAFPNRKVMGHVWEDMPLLEVLQRLVDRSFYSHYTAVRIHGLTEQVPQTVFLNQEKRKSSTVYSNHPESFTQEVIDAAFAQAPRESKNQITAGHQRIVLLESAYQAGLGITSSTVNWDGPRDLVLRHTTLERTLIDIVVRPFYAGGVFEVAKAFENAKDRGVSVNTLASMLKRMAFGYPYHQAIGYYLQRAGYKPSLVALFRQLPIERDFYLTHAMDSTDYIAEWRLHVPQGF